MLKVFAKNFLKKKPRPEGDLIWINGVSIGEAENRNYNCRTNKKK